MANNNTTPVSLDALAVGRSSTNPFITVFSQRNPLTTDVNYPIQQRWYNEVAETEYILTAFSVVNETKTAIWQPINASQVMATETLTGNSGGAVAVDLNNNINVIGDTTTINIVGNPGTHTLTVSTTGAVATTYTEDTGSATPSLGNLNVLGTNGLHTTGSGSTITISSTNGQLMTGVIPDAHTAPGTTPVVPNSSGNITVTGGQVAAGTTTNVIRTNSLAANTYTVEVQRSQAVASSTVGDNGVSHFNSSIFSVDSNGFVGLSTSFYTTGTFTPSLQFGGATTGITYSSRGGSYTRIGNVLFFALSFTLTSKGTAIGAASVAGFPFTTMGGGGSPIDEGNITFAAGNTYIYASPNIGTTTYDFFQSGSGIPTSILSQGNFSDDSVVVINGFYFLS